jgi:carbonic anhydrase/acetyltransferase-like protein (isoleucine patch superfamily)
MNNMELIELIRAFEGKYPSIHKKSFIADSADIIGEVTIEEEANIWYGAVLRGDVNYISIGRGSNIQDNCTVHTSPRNFPAVIGQYVTIGHNAIIHGCVIGDNCLIGMGSIILDGAEIGEGTIIGAGSIVSQGKKIPSGVLCLGSPARVIRELTVEEKQKIKETAKSYISLYNKYIKEEDNKND